MNFKLKDILLAGIILLFIVSIWDICNNPRSQGDFFVRTRPHGAGYDTGRGFNTADEPQATSRASLEASAAGVKFFELYNPHGAVRIVGTDTDTIKVAYKIKIWADSREEARKYLKGMSIRLTSEGDKARIVRKENGISRRIRGIVVEYDITAPKALALDLSNNFGAMAATGFDGDSQFDNRYGSTKIEDMGGSVDLTARYADLDLRDIGGDAEVETAYQSSDIENIGGSLAIDAKYSQLDITGVSKSADIQNKYGKIDVEGVTGDLKVSAQYTGVSGSQNKGSIDVGASYGNVEFEDVSKNAEIDLRYGNISLELADGSNGYRLDSEARNGVIDLDGINASVDRDSGRDKASATVGQGKYLITTHSEHGNTAISLR